MNSIVNIASYKFVTLDDLPGRRSTLKELCGRLGLKGTILLSPEGINMFLAGTRESIDEYLRVLREHSEFAELEVKESFSDYQPFTRMLVRLKKEIIAFGVESVDPRRKSAPRIEAKELKRWLDEGRPVTLLDTRNDYEIQVGTFRNAIPARVDDFRHFPEAIAKLPEELKEQPIVTFCTGGIRCEKAAPFMEQAGFKNVYQLEGGILKYFEECGGDHYDGECFVFDQRVALDPQLKETDTAQCYACQTPLTAMETRSPFFEPGVSCPHCHVAPEVKLSDLLDQRHEELAELTNPLPGAAPYVNRRPISVPQHAEGTTLIEFLESLRTIQTSEDWRNVIDAGQLLLNEKPIAADHVLKTGRRLIHIIPHTVEPPVNADIEILFEDDGLLVVNKPAPLPMHPCGRFNRNSLQYILEQLIHPFRPRPVHRLDSNTSGIVVCAKMKRVAAGLQPQFENGTVRKRYVAKVHGHPVDDAFESTAAISREPTQTGGRAIDPDGLASHTKFTVSERRDDGTSLIECIPVTGRTNQIRLHLWDLGHPIVGDPMYLPGKQLGAKQTLEPGDPSLCLHAASIEFEHPTTRERMTFEVAPKW